MASVTKGKNEDRAASDDESPVNPTLANQGSKSAKGNDVEDENDDLPGEDEKADKKQGVPGKSIPAYRGKEERPQKRGSRFFTIYKSGQGYWTRMGTALGAGLLGVVLSYTIYDKLPSFFPSNPTLGKKIALEVSAGFLIVWSGVAWWLMNKPANADFLIATDSEMKKVNWTSRKELIGSTRIVIIFMFSIAFFLFAVDEVWGWLMYLAKVLTIKPPPFS
jgi:preprotein translocase subunit SecE